MGLLQISFLHIDHFRDSFFQTMVDKSDGESLMLKQGNTTSMLLNRGNYIKDLSSYPW